MKRPIPFLIVVCALMATGPPSLHAVTGTPEPTPAATLLLPYFEVDEELDIDTLFSIANANAEPVLTNVTLWTNRSVPTIRFNVYLGGFDLQTIDLGEVFGGTLPRTGETVHDAGAFSLENVAFPGCSDPVAQDLTDDEIAHIRAAHSGQPSETFGGLCAGALTGGSFTGYVTIDAVERCSSEVPFPSSDGYFEDPERVASDRNVLWGDWELRDPANDLAVGETLVHVEADAFNFETASPGEYTFYGRYVGGQATDHREPLATVWQAPFEEATETATSLLVWRDALTDVEPFECGTVPSPFLLGQNGVVFFDAAGVGEPLTAALAPNETQRTFVEPIAETRKGAAFLNLNTTIVGGTTFSGDGEGFSQSFVTVLRELDGLFFVGHSGVWLDSATNPDRDAEP